MSMLSLTYKENYYKLLFIYYLWFYQLLFFSIYLLLLRICYLYIYCILYFFGRELWFRHLELHRFFLIMDFSENLCANNVTKNYIQLNTMKFLRNWKLDRNICQGRYINDLRSIGKLIEEFNTFTFSSEICAWPYINNCEYF